MATLITSNGDDQLKYRLDTYTRIASLIRGNRPCGRLSGRESLLIHDITRLRGRFRVVFIAF